MCNSVSQNSISVCGNPAKSVQYIMLKVYICENIKNLENTETFCLYRTDVFEVGFLRDCWDPVNDFIDNNFKIIAHSSAFQI